MSRAARPPVIVIAGPTASGKTALGVELARRLDGEVISADSMQIYRRMDVGTAKPEREEMQGVPHHMLSVAEPGENWSVARWAEGAAACAEEIYARGKRPLLVGGTGLYIDAFLAGTEFADAPSDMRVRERLNEEYDALGGDAFREKLAAIDPERAQKLAPADKKRLVRAMEVYLLTGETISAHDKRTRSIPPRYDSVRFAVSCRERETLYERIRLRVDLMLARGLFEEVASLLAEGVPAEGTAMQAIGYKEAAAALRGECTREEAAELIKTASCRYAKRQLTWFRRDAGLQWLYREDFPDAVSGADEILRRLQEGN